MQYEIMAGIPTDWWYSYTLQLHQLNSDGIKDTFQLHCTCAEVINSNFGCFQEAKFHKVAFCYAQIKYFRENLISFDFGKHI
jgi:hypothetical protein